VDEFTSAEQALVAVHHVVATIRDDDLHRPTPCPDWDVAALAEHLIDTICRLGTASGIQTVPPIGDSIDQRIQQVTQPILEGRRRRGLVDEVVFSGRTLPAYLALRILSLELVVHGWDFAVALHLPLDVSDAHAAFVLGLARQTLTAESRVIARFDPPVEVPANAGELDRLIAFTGRQPQQMKARSAVMNMPTIQTYSRTPTHVVRATGGFDFAYRRVGNRGGIPLVLGNYFAANLDDWDPLIVDGLAADRDVITFDYPGIGCSTGTTPATVAELAVECIAFLHALGLPSVDFLGHSLGGMVAQQIASSHPDMIRRMILCGTGPRGGEKLTFTELSIDELSDPVALLMNSFFTPSEASQAAGHEYLKRLSEREANRDTPVSTSAAVAQLAAIRGWGEIPTTDRYAMLTTIRQPTLIVHGTKDIVVDSVNAVILERHLSGATLLMFPDASHGAQSQHAEVFLAIARLFLNP
jgi:uncharacterized protein (TIGR03086 family)